MEPLSYKPILVRQRPLTFYAFIAGGVFFLVFPWVLVGEAPLWAKLFWNALGLLSIVVGLLGLKYLRLALVIDQDGLRFLSWSMPLRRVLVHWDEIEGVEHAHWTDIEGENEAIVLGLTEEVLAKVTSGKEYVDRIRTVSPRCADQRAGTIHLS